MAGADVYLCSMKFRTAILAPLSAACLFFACKAEDTSVIDTTYGTAQPHIAGFALSADALDTGVLPPASHAPLDTVAIHVTVHLGLQHDTPADAITAARLTVTAPSGAVLQIVTLHNDGVAPDLAAGDSVFSANVTLSILRKQSGTYRFSAQITNRDGNDDSRTAMLDIINSSNHAPVLSALDVPDTVRVPPHDSLYVYLFTVKATDAEGLDDVRRVSADVHDAAGKLSGSLDLYDDGDVALHGDETAGDGTYSRLVRTDSSNTPNTVNTFKFYAIDRAGAVSDTLSKVIYTK